MPRGMGMTRLNVRVQLTEAIEGKGASHFRRGLRHSHASGKPFEASIALVDARLHRNDSPTHDKMRNLQPWDAPEGKRQRAEGRRKTSAKPDVFAQVKGYCLFQLRTLGELEFRISAWRLKSRLGGSSPSLRTMKS